MKPLSLIFIIKLISNSNIFSYFSYSEIYKKGTKPTQSTKLYRVVSSSTSKHFLTEILLRNCIKSL